jgi:hypothetical protein
MRRSMLLLATALGAALSACGTETTADDPLGVSPTTDDEPFVVANGETMVSCGSDAAGWPPSVMTEGVQGPLTDDEARRIFQGILNDPMTGEEAALSLFPDGVDVDWRVLHEDGNSLTIGLGRWTEQGPTGESARILELEREGEAWGTAGWAGCQLSPVLKEGNSWVEVTGYHRDEKSARLTAQVQEHVCTSGRDPEPFLHEPFVVETSDRVTIYLTSEPPEGGQDCQGTPPVDRVVELNQPLGTRLVFDGFSYPPREVRAR